MSLYPFPTNIYRTFPETDVEVVKRDEHGTPTAVCVTAHTTGDCAIALVLLQESPDSFVLSDGVRYLPDGTVQRCDPACPASMTELHRSFDVEKVEVDWPGPRSRVYIFTHTEQEWENAKSAVRHLLDQKLLSSRSYIEGDYMGEDQGLSAKNLDAQPHSAGLVALFREAAYCVQNDLCEPPDVGEVDEEEIREYSARLHEERSDDDDWEEDDWDEAYADEEGGWDE